MYLNCDTDVSRLPAKNYTGSRRLRDGRHSVFLCIFLLCCARFRRLSWDGESLKMRQISGVTLGKMQRSRSRGAVSKCNHRSRGRRPPTRHLIGVFGLRPRGCARGLNGELTPGLRREWTVWETWGSLTFDRCVNGPKCPGCVMRAAPGHRRTQERGPERARNAPGGARRS